MNERTFFNKEIETLSKEKLQALQLQRLQAIVERAYTQNEFYRHLYDEAGVKPSDIKVLEDIRKLPFLEKKTVRAAYPYGMALARPGKEGERYRFMRPAARRARAYLCLPRRKILATGQISTHASYG